MTVQQQIEKIWAEIDAQMEGEPDTLSSAQKAELDTQSLDWTLFLSDQ